MDPTTNPYSPGAGRLPAALAGRSTQLQLWDVTIRRVSSGKDAQPIVLHGLRGVGKTVLLSRFGKMARESGWLVAQVEAKSGSTMRDMVGEAFHEPLVDMARPGIGQRVLKALKTALSFKASYDTAGTWNFGVDLSGAKGGGADTGVLESDLGKLLRDLSGAVAEEGTGVALLVDEAQDLPHDELVALCSIAHAAIQRQDRIVIALAGLPSLPRRLAEAKSYSERLFSFQSVGSLSSVDARAALLEPAHSEGVEWEEAALGHVLEAADGYPYFLQQFGQDTWNAAEQSPLTLHDARVGVAYGQAGLDQGFFRARWERTTDAEKRYLRAMAVDGDAGSTAADLAQRLHRKVTSLAPTRASLIVKGLIYSPDHGVIAYTVPAMDSFVLRQPE